MVDQNYTKSEFKNSLECRVLTSQKPSEFQSALLTSVVGSERAKLRLGGYRIPPPYDESRTISLKGRRRMKGIQGVWESSRVDYGGEPGSRRESARLGKYGEWHKTETLRVWWRKISLFQWLTLVSLRLPLQSCGRACIFEAVAVIAVRSCGRDCLPEAVVVITYCVCVALRSVHGIHSVVTLNAFIFLCVYFPLQSASKTDGKYLLLKSLDPWMQVHSTLYAIVVRRIDIQFVSWACKSCASQVLDCGT